MTKKRTDIRQYFDETAKIVRKDEFDLSESGLYYFETQQYKQTDINRNWTVTKIQIGHIEKDGHFFEYLTDYEYNCSLWIYKDKKDYLLLPEFQGGQSVFDVEEKKLYSFYSEDDPFIWANIFVSPDNTKLAVTGCYWACPFEIVVYDCSNLTELPYACIYRQLLDTNFEIKEWEDNRTIVMTNNKKEEQRLKI
ncbi:hypothetical protein J2X31_003606 [Flavobacterium arsenatis]|uniref:DUF4178 domain-containing protein n=1 Tax=Flavobacterium arsenatis TaxID=1484332 RepID=A0ABU1TUN8_9FLAO|nr:hypothetical protein [Flavobacterium arsenatis]MDR6969573.1 hypothetical protein [Flavobacterium arsenatis]